MTEAGGWAQWTASEAVSQRSCYQDPIELAQLLQLLADQYQPKLVLEIGGGQGGSAWAWGQIGSVAEVMTVTLPDPARKWFCCPMGPKHWVYVGDSTTADTEHMVRYHLDGRQPDFVWIDGDHSYKTAALDWHTYGSLVSPDGLVGLHDIRTETRYPGFEVDRLWAEIKPVFHTAELLGGPGIAMGTGLVFARVTA